MLVRAQFLRRDGFALPRGRRLHVLTGGGGLRRGERHAPAEGSYWRWVYETAIIRITTNKDIASDWANPKGTTYASTYACLPGSECRPASGGAWYSKRVVARHYTPWCVGLKRGVTAAGYAAIIARLQGVGNLTTGKLT